MKTKIYFEDCGQDFLWWIIENNEIVDCGPFQSSIWCGKRVCCFDKIGVKPAIELKSGEIVQLKYKVIKLEKIL